MPQRKPIRLLATAAMAVCASALPAVSGALSPEPVKQDDREAARVEARIDRLWVREWENFAVFYVPYGDGFACFPDYEEGRGGNGEMSVEDYIRETAYEIEYEDENRRDHTLLVAKPREDAQAAMWLLRDPSPGDFGYIHSGLIREIVDGDELIVTHVGLVHWPTVYEARQADLQKVLAESFRLVTGRELPEEDKGKLQRGNDNRQDARQRTRSLSRLRPAMREAVNFRYADRAAAYERQKEEDFIALRWRIIGFNTENLTVGARWPQGEAAEEGLHLAVVDVQADGTVVAIPLALLEREMTELQFLDVIQDRQVTKDQFYDWVMAARREHGRDGYVRAVLDLIEGVEEDAGTEEAPEGKPEDERPPVNDSVELAD